MFYTDLFTALHDKENPRAHPVLAALTYAFCPAAARWWLAGADPEIPFDPLWKALTDRAGGKTLKDALAGYGFGNLLDHAREYIGQIAAYRRLHPAIIAPETMPAFDAQRASISQRYGSKEAIDALGGKWENFYIYLRTWAYVAPDWIEHFKLDPKTAQLDAIRLAITLPGMRKPAFFPAWQWLQRSGRAARVVVGLATIGSEADQLRFSLAARASLSAEKDWPERPELWALDRYSGAASVFKSCLPENLERIVFRLAETAEKTPGLPLNALQRSAICRVCGYHSQCYSGLGEITSLALGS